MLANLQKLSIAGGIGLLIGIAAVSYIEPTNAGGTGLLLVICMVIALLCAELVARWRGKQAPGAREGEGNSR